MPDMLFENPATQIWLLLVPGVVILFVRSQFVITRIAFSPHIFMLYFTVSLVYHALALPVLDLHISHDASFLKKTLVWFLYVFITPGVIGLLLGINVQRNFIRRVMQYVGLNPVHSIPTAWDWKFGKMTVPGEWVLVTLKNGTRFAGFCGPESFMSSEPDERDLYIEQVYDLDDEGRWRSRGENGVLVAGGEISTIEFWPAETEREADEEK